MNFDFLGRIFAWVAALNAILTSAIVALTPLAETHPFLVKVLAVLVFISAVITPFLPRAQGAPAK